MIKLMLCSVLCICSLMSSYEVYSERLRSAEKVRELADSVYRMISLLRFEAADVYEICRSAFNGSEFVDFSEFKGIDSGDFTEKWHNACLNLRADKDAVRIFERVGRILGSCDCESQTAMLAGISSELSERAKSLKSSAERSKRLYITFGAAIGIGISIIII